LREKVRSDLAQEAGQQKGLAAELLNTNQGPIYLRDGEAIPDGIDPERVVSIKRVFVDPPPARQANP
jgi:hypothetical protein